MRYIGGFEGEAGRAITAAAAKRVIDAQRDLGSSRKDRVAACMRILRAGRSIGDQYGYWVRAA